MHSRLRGLTLTLAAVICALALAACGGGGDNSADPDELASTLTICLQDAGLKPVDVSAENIDADDAELGIARQLDFDDSGASFVSVKIFETEGDAGAYAEDVQGTLEDGVEGVTLPEGVLGASAESYGAIVVESPVENDALAQVQSCAEQAAG